MQETWVQSLGWKDTLEKGMVTHSSILTGESHGQKSLMGYSPWGHKESDTTEWLTYPKNKTIISIQFSCSVMSDSLWPHGLQHTRPPCPSPTPGVYPNSCSLSRWCHPTISSSVVPFSSHLQSFPASGSFQMSQLFTSGGQYIGISVSRVRSLMVDGGKIEMWSK